MSRPSSVAVGHGFAKLCRFLGHDPIMQPLLSVSEAAELLGTTVGRRANKCRAIHASDRDAKGRDRQQQLAPT
jgi:hypothetical protein